MRMIVGRVSLCALSALSALSVGCAGEEKPGEAAWQFWDSGPALRGSGNPGRTFTEAELWQNCATLDGGAEDAMQHNLQLPYRGHLVLPWAPEQGQGGLSLFDMADPCAPERVGDGFTQDARETHAMGFVYLPPDDPHAGDWAVGNGKQYGSIDSGILFWDLSDPAAPAVASLLVLPEAWYPDSYTRVVLSVFWQYPWVYVASADNGVFVVDATDPRAPVLVNQISFGMRAGGVFALGNELLVTSAEQTVAALFDISDPANPVMLPGSPFGTVTRDGAAVETYHGNRVGDLALFARKEGGGGPILIDISDPEQPFFAGDAVHNGNGGYVFMDEDVIFVGESDHASVWDASDPANLSLIGTGLLAGDLDTIVPWGNVALLSVDHAEGEDPSIENAVATAIMPWRADPDTAGPVVLSTSPEDGDAGLYQAARIGIGFNEFIEPASAFPGSIRLLDADGAPVECYVSVQETVATCSPAAPLLPDHAYTVEVEGVTDIHGNPMIGVHRFSFRSF